ncbi:hypothetical protein [Barnesiella intestinihominis]
MKHSPEPAEADAILCLEIFYAEANRISLRHTLDYGKQLIHAYSTPERID